MIDKLIHKSLCLLSPERAHAVAKWAMKKKLRAPVQPGVAGHGSMLFGRALTNYLGLAAGFDKNGELVEVFEDYGFGFLEVGSVTRNGGQGNPKPRLFRIGDDALLNRMGLNGEPADYVAHRLRWAKNPGPYGVNIAKTHSPEIMGDAAIRDISDCYQTMRPYGFYTVLNISCPNTREGKTFEDPAALRELLAEVVTRLDYRNYKPLLVKLSPISTITNGMRWSELDKLIDVCLEFKIDGFVCCNTIPQDHPKFGRGGLSGPECFQQALGVVKFIRGVLAKSGSGQAIIGCGGIRSGYEMWEYENAGALAFQSYAGFVRGPNAGPQFASKVLQQFYSRSNA